MSTEQLRSVTVVCSRLYLIRSRYANIRSEALTDKEEAWGTTELRIDLAHLSSDLKYPNALPLRLRAACVPYARHPTNEFDAPSVRKNTQSENAQPENEECSHHKRSPRSASRVSSLFTSMRVCARSWRHTQCKRGYKSKNSVLRYFLK